MQKNALWVDQCPCHLSAIDGNLPWGSQHELVYNFLDDIVIFLKDPASCLMRLDTMFKKLEHARLKLKPLKCEVFHKQIISLGHIISAQGIATDRKKTEVIEMWSTTHHHYRGLELSQTHGILPTVHPQVHPDHLAFWLHYRAGKTNINVDALSRVSCPRCMTDTIGMYQHITTAVV